jgi:hypothetical protein
MLDRLLSRVEEEMIPERMLEPAAKLLTDMLAESPRLRQDPARWERTTNLLRRVQELRDDEARRRRSLLTADRPGRFRALAERRENADRLMARVVRRGQLMTTHD